MEDDGDPERTPFRMVKVQVTVEDEDAMRIKAVSRLLSSDTEAAHQSRQLLEHMLSQVHDIERDDERA